MIITVSLLLKCERYRKTKYDYYCELAPDVLTTQKGKVYYYCELAPDV